MMNLKQIANVLPKGATRNADFEMWASKSTFVKECEYVSEAARQAIGAELSNVFSLYSHKSGKFVAVTLYFSAKGIESTDRWRHLIVDCRGAELEAEIAPNIKEAKIQIRRLLDEEAATSKATEEIPKGVDLALDGKVVSVESKPVKAKKSKAASKPATTK